MRHIIRFNESQDIDKDFLEDCFIELVDMGICQVSTHQRVNGHGLSLIHI